jgi:hypothetical protein
LRPCIHSILSTFLKKIKIKTEGGEEGKEGKKERGRNEEKEKKSLQGTGSIAQCRVLPYV